MLERVSEPQLRHELALLSGLRRLEIELRSFVGLGSSSSSIIEPPKPTGEICDLIDNLSHFDLLESLSIFAVLLEDIPAGIRNLKKLKHLGMSFAGLREIPDWLAELEHLRSLR